ncbi:MAG TPA: tetratricopeptide repeat protein, partial [Chitinophagales bacterium]|nr:tetratricopeptide repeat protein [Chitinophagales bacterium]
SYPYTDPAIKLPTMLLIFGWCIKLALVPFPLAYSYAYNQIPPVTWASPFVWVALIAGLGVLYVAVKGLKTWQQYSFGILFFLVALAPAMGFVLLRGGILAERFLYAPVLGLCVVVVWALSKYGKADFSSALTVNSVLRQPLFAIPFIALLLLYSGETVERNFDWYSNFALFTHDANVVENSCQAQLHSGTSYIEAAIRDHGQKERVEAFNAGMQHLNKALNINPHLAEAIYEKARAFHYLVGNTDSAVLYYNQSIMEGPTYALSYFGLGQLYENLGKQELASYYFNKGVQIDPYNQEGLAARDEHRKKTGLDVKTFPSQSNDIAGADDGADKGFDYYNNKGTDFGKRGDFANGAKYLEKAVELNPTSAEAWVNLSICQAGLKQYSKGIASLEKVLEMYPNNESAIRNIVVMYDFTGQKAKADEYREKLKALGN